MKKSLDILWERIKQESKQRIIQAKEYERRLEDLNGEAGRIKEVQKDSIPREVFDRTINSMSEKGDDRMKEILDKIEILTAWKTKQEGRNQLIQWVPWVIAIVAIIANYFKK
jgi:cell fate (sporulation/competence/biofilm development) regulator YmcA (YheA/YmcA/DUF963 family)